MNDRHPIEYEMKISFNKDEVVVVFTGETVEFSNKANAPVRPRHLRIVSEIHRMMRDYIRDNKDG
jgi:hypothetical protein